MSGSAISQHSSQESEAGSYFGLDRPHADSGIKSSSGSTRSQFAVTLNNHFSLLLEEEASGRVNVSLEAQKPLRYRGVTKHKRTQRYEAHIWEAKKQIYLGGFDSELLAAKSHDIMALRCKGLSTDLLNFPISEYRKLTPYIDRLSREEVVTSLRNYSKAQVIKKPSAGLATKGGVHKVSSPRSAESKRAIVNSTGTSADKLRIVTDCTASKVNCTGKHMRPARYAGHGASQQADGVKRQGDAFLSPDPETPQSQLKVPTLLEPFTPVAVSSRPRGRAGASRMLRPPPAQLLPSPPVIPRGEARAPAPCAVFLSRPKETMMNESLDSPFCAADSMMRQDTPRQAISKAIDLLNSGACSSELLPTTDVWARGHATLGGVAPLEEHPPQKHDVANSVAVRHAVPQQPMAEPAFDCLNDLDLDAVSEMLQTDESLTFSASEESRLYEWMPVDSGHSGLEHTLNGTVLFRSPAEKQEHEKAALALSQDTSLSSVLTDIPSSTTGAVSELFCALHPCFGRFSDCVAEGCNAASIRAHFPFLF